MKKLLILSLALFNVLCYGPHAEAWWHDRQAEDARQDAILARRSLNEILAGGLNARRIDGVEIVRAETMLDGRWVNGIELVQDETMERRTYMQLKVPPTAVFAFRQSVIDGLTAAARNKDAEFRQSSTPTGARKFYMTGEDPDWWRGAREHSCEEIMLRSNGQTVIVVIPPNNEDVWLYCASY